MYACFCPFFTGSLQFVREARKLKAMYIFLGILACAGLMAFLVVKSSAPDPSDKREPGKIIPMDPHEPEDAIVDETVLKWRRGQTN